MKLEHYVIEKSILAEYPLHLYITPLTNTWGKVLSLDYGFCYVPKVFAEGPAVVFRTLENKVAILSKTKLNRWWNFRDTRLRRYLDPVRIHDAKEPVNVRDIEKAVLGNCNVEACDEMALFEETIGLEEGRTYHACSSTHMEQLCGYESFKIVPLNHFSNIRHLMIHL